MNVLSVLASHDASIAYFVDNKLEYFLKEERLSGIKRDSGVVKGLNYIIKNDLADKDYIDKYTDGFEELKNHVTDKTPEWAAKITGVNKEHIEKLAFELASRACFKEACTQGGLKLLEPIMRVEVVTPEDYMGDVIGDLNSRRGQISTQEQRGNATVITAMVPLANMFGYINNLRSMSQGRAQYSMFFDHYSKVPQNVQDEVTKKVAG